MSKKVPQKHDGSGDNVAGNKYVNQPQPLTGRTGALNNLGSRGIAPDRFVGRDEKLVELHRRLMEREVVAIAGVVGMGGVGKTELAVQYGRSRAEDFAGGVVWLPGERLVSELLALARQWFLTTADLDYLARLSSEGEQVQFCWSRWPGDRERVLVIVDDVVDFATQVKSFVPPGDRFRVLVTTRDRQLLPEGDCLFLDVLELAAALALLAGAIGEERLGREREGAEELVERLGRLPLAIELVGAFLKQRREWSLAKMLGRLTEKGLAARALTKVPQTAQAERGVAAAFALSWEVLSDDQQRLAVLLGCFGTGPIPWELVEYCLPEVDEDELEDWREEGLVRLSWLTLEGEGHYGLHPLVRKFFGQQRQFRDDGKALQQEFLNTLVCVAKTVPPNPTLADQARVRSAIPHLEQAAQCTDQITTDDRNYTLPFAALAHLAEAQSLWPKAEQYQRAALQVSETRLGADHPDAASIVNSLALLYKSQGRYEEAQPLYERSLQIRESQLGAEHPDTATSLNNLAELYRVQGRYGEALPLYERSLEIYELQLGAEHPSTATILNNLAGIYCAQGLYEEALPLYERSLQIRESQQGAEHPNTADSLHNLAFLYGAQGRYWEALPLCERSLQIKEKQLGAEHPATAVSYGNLGELLIEFENYQKAEQHLLKALEIFIKSFEREHHYVQETVRRLVSLIQTVIANQQTAQLSDHSLTQALLQKFTSRSPQTDD
ncbi:MAG: tetratricopeptide repeat-containing protein [Cyanobacteria bacterium P01_H01_bin.130]